MKTVEKSNAYRLSSFSLWSLWALKKKAHVDVNGHNLTYTSYQNGNVMWLHAVEFVCASTLPSLLQFVVPELNLLRSIHSAPWWSGYVV